MQFVVSPLAICTDLSQIVLVRTKHRKVSGPISSGSSAKQGHPEPCRHRLHDLEPGGHGQVLTAMENHSPKERRGWTKALGLGSCFGEASARQDESVEAERTSAGVEGWAKTLAGGQKERRRSKGGKCLSIWAFNGR